MTVCRKRGAEFLHCQFKVEDFWAPGSKCPKERFEECFFGFREPQKCQKALLGAHFPSEALRARRPKALQKHSLGHFPARAPGTPVNGGRDRNITEWFEVLTKKMPNKKVTCFCNDLGCGGTVGAEKDYIPLGPLGLHN